jgi:hypothetical protein
MALLVIDIDLVIIEVTIITYLWLISLASVIDYYQGIGIMIIKIWNNHAPAFKYIGNLYVVRYVYVMIITGKLNKYVRKEFLQS